MPYYAVRLGRIPGIYKNWGDCQKQIEKFPRARYKKFETEAEATAFVNGDDIPNVKGSSSSTVTKQAASASHTSRPDDKLLQIKEHEVEVLKERLKLAKQESKVLQKESGLKQLKEELKGQKEAPSKIKTSKKFSVPHGTSPYKRPETASSATKLIDVNEVRELHKTPNSSDSESGSAIVVYTDGACIHNGNSGAMAGIGVYWGPDHHLNTSERLPGRQTNNRAEIYAIVKAAKQAKECGLKEITVKTDSQFVINSMTKWLQGWKKKGWKTSAGETVKNKDDFLDLEQASIGLKINWIHVKGHDGIEGNECADRLAMKGAKMGLA